MYWQLDCDSKEAMHVEAKVYVSNYIHVCKLLGIIIHVQAAGSFHT